MNGVGGVEAFDLTNDAMPCWRHQPVPPAATLTGTVTRIGYYGDTLPKLIITVKKTAVTGIPFKDGERIKFPLVVDGVAYTAGIRTTARAATVMVCPDLNDSSGLPVRLADLLFSHGLTQSRLKLLVNDYAIYCCHDGSSNY